MRFVTFGCSITYGEGLPDCVSENLKWAGPNPSSLSWAALLAKKFNLELINMALPGASNFYICNKIHDFYWQPGDIALPLFTYFNRYTIFNENCPPKNITPHDTSASTSNINNNVEQAIQFYDLFNNYHLGINDALSINASLFFLLGHNIPVVARIVGDVQQEQYFRFTKTNKWVREISKTPFLDFKVDIGLDLGKHPGPKSHELFAESLIQDVDNIINMRK